MSYPFPFTEGSWEVNFQEGYVKRCDKRRIHMTFKPSGHTLNSVRVLRDLVGHKLTSIEQIDFYAAGGKRGSTIQSELFNPRDTDFKFLEFAPGELLTRAMIRVA